MPVAGLLHREGTSRTPFLGKELRGETYLQSVTDSERHNLVTNT